MNHGSLKAIKDFSGATTKHELPAFTAVVSTNFPAALEHTKMNALNCTCIVTHLEHPGSDLDYCALLNVVSSLYIQGFLFYYIKQWFNYGKQ